MKKAYLFNTGCIRRALDSTRVYNYLINNGWTFVNKISKADLVVISTCAAVQEDEDLALEALNTVAAKKADHTKVIVTGCLPKINPEKINETKELDEVYFVPTRESDKIDSILNSKIRLKDVPVANLVSNEIGLLDYVLGYRLFRHSRFLNTYKKFGMNREFIRSVLVLSDLYNDLKDKFGLNHRQKFIPYYNIRIADGCLFKCSYCCIRFATGKLNSKPIENIAEEFEKGLKEGHKIFQLVCEDVGCYGLDIGTTFPSLLRRLLEIEGDYQILLIDFGGHWLVKYYDELLQLFTDHPDKIRELYCSLQSGSQKILNAMKRPEKGEGVRAKLKELKRKLPHLTLRTTVIIGFPGETEEDYRETVEAVTEIDFSVVELNKYTDRPGTASSKMDNKVPQKIIDRRTRDLDRLLSNTGV
jgi:MiaB/RimO family radical SAM methylthiotransferase